MLDDSIGRSITLLLILIVAYAFFAGSETAFSYSNHVRMKLRAEDGDRQAGRVLYLTDRFDKLLATILVGTNISNVLASSVATVIAVHFFGNVGSVYATVAMTLIIFLFAETLPKNISRKNPDKTARRFSGLILFFFYAFTPITAFFTALSGAVKRAFQHGHAADPTYTEDEFQSIVEDFAEEGDLDADESQIIQSAVEFADIRARDIMIPVQDVLMVNTRQSQEELRDLVLHVRYSRVPVCGQNADHILGILQVRDCLYELARGGEVNLLNNLRPTCFAGPDTPVDQLFEEMRHYRNHMAIITDKGKTLGMVTMEDLLEELVGDIYDEEDVRSTRRAQGGAQ